MRGANYRFLPVPIDLIDLSKIDGPLLQEILCNGKKIYQQQDHLLGVLYVRLMDWRTDFMPAWENMLDQRRKRFLAKENKLPFPNEFHRHKNKAGKPS